MEGKDYFTPVKHARAYTRSGEEIDSQLKLKYNGHYPKKLVKGNINYLDHNILSLGNRQSVSNAKDNGLYDSVNAAYRSGSSVNLQYKHSIRGGTS